MKCLLLLIAVFPLALANFPFSTVLTEGYTLAWNFNAEEETIKFQVNVSTTGWVGLGLSPDGGMPNSDVVIGWVDSDGQAFLHDRYADAQGRPPVDNQQDWILESGTESNGVTVLQFSRKWVTCDDKDRNIEAQTARVIFSWNPDDPLNNDPNLVLYHGRERRGATSLNLLGGEPNPPPEPDDSRSFFVGVENVVIPNADTTYLCVAVRLPQEVISGTHYIYKYSPEIQASNTAFVHHIIIYHCDALLNVTEGASEMCFGDVTSVTPVGQCRDGAVLAGWAVGGGDFIFPEGVAFPVSGEGRGTFAVIEMHYDNPDEVSGVVDSSGVRFFYTARQPTFEAGQTSIGTETDHTVIIPPNVQNFTVIGQCSVDCTQTHVPATGIKIFANFFHTHLAGHGLVLEHYRRTSGCGGELEQLAPIDINLQYDFNFQQTTILPREVTVLPGDVLLLKCFYNTMGRSNITLGGEATRDEMCLTFPLYYPADTLFVCGSVPTEASYEPFIQQSVPESLQEEFRGLTERINAPAYTGFRPSREEVFTTFNKLEWTQEQSQNFEDAIVGGSVHSGCIGSENNGEVTIEQVSAVPDPTCRYRPPDVCATAHAHKFVVDVLLVLALAAFTTLF